MQGGCAEEEWGPWQAAPEVTTECGFALPTELLARQCEATRRIQLWWRRYRQTTSSLCNPVCEPVSDGTCGDEVEPSGAQGDFRTLPGHEWAKLNERFLSDVHCDRVICVKEHESGPKGDAFNEIEAVLIVKDFTLVLDSLFEAHGIEIADRTAGLRRHVEGSLVEIAASEWDEGGCGAPDAIEDALRNLADAVNDWANAEHGICVRGELNVAEWLSDHRARRPSPGRLDREPLQDTSRQELARAPSATPAWTGLAVSKRESHVASSLPSRINRHGGSTKSSLHKGRHTRKHKQVGLERGGDGKHKSDNR